MNISRVVEIKIFDHQGLPLSAYEIDVSTSLLGKKWGKLVYRILRECMNAAVSGGLVVIRGTLTPRM